MNLSSGALGQSNKNNSNLNKYHKKVVAVLPARMASTRFPNKPLAKILGKEMILWVAEGAAKSKLVDEVIIATDHIEIQKVAQKAGWKVAMTSSDLPSGSDRIWAAIQDYAADIVVNVQGDEPLINGDVIDATVQPLLENLDLEMSTLAHTISVDELYSENVVKVIVDANSCAIYFSRFPIPYSREKVLQKVEGQPSIVNGCLKHIGLYAYKKTFLQKYCSMAPVTIETSESLEQLRALYLGAKIKVVPVDFQSQGVDVPSDIAKVEARLQNFKK